MMINQTASSTPAMKSWAVLTLIKRAWASNAALTFIGVLFLLAFIGTSIGIVIDPRIITGAPAWLKPAKFAISSSIYAWTFVWLLSFVRGHRRLMWLITHVTAFALLVENIIIFGQAARGMTSHYNFATPLDASLYVTMALLIVLLWTMSLIAAILLIRQRLPDPVFAWGLRLGVLIAFVGMGLAFLMTARPTPAQSAAIAAGQPVQVIGAHNVGVEDGGPGLPVVGWSTVGGDLRIGHFLGLHGMQVLPFVGWVLAHRRATWLSAGKRLTLVWTAGVSYLGLMLIVTWQALRGQSVIAPDAPTLGALAVLIGGTGLVVGSVLLRARYSAEHAGV